MEIPGPFYITNLVVTALPSQCGLELEIKGFVPDLVMELGKYSPVNVSIGGLLHLTNYDSPYGEASELFTYCINGHDVKFVIKTLLEKCIICGDEVEEIGAE